jgi:MraZ protein
VVESPSTDVVTSGSSSLDPLHEATLFRGRGEYSIDDKGRLTLPPHMRKPLAEGGNLVVLDGRVVLWAEVTYRRLVDDLRAQVAGHELTGSALRAFLANTHPVVPDTQGRIVVPHAARIEGGLDREVLVLGSGPRIEIVPAGSDDLEGALGVPTEIAVALDRAQF